MSKLVSKIYFEEIVEEKETLPKGLKFLEGVTFYAITEYIIAKKRQARIEFLPSDLCNIINKAKRYESLSKIVEKTYKVELHNKNKLIKEYDEQLSQEKAEHTLTKNECESLRRDNDKMRNNIILLNSMVGTYIEKARKRSEDSTSRLKENGIDLKRRPLPGSVYR